MFERNESSYLLMGNELSGRRGLTRFGIVIIVFDSIITTGWSLLDHARTCLGNDKTH